MTNIVYKEGISIFYTIFRDFNRRIFMESVPCIKCKKRDDEWEAQNKLDPVFDKE